MFILNLTDSTVCWKDTVIYMQQNTHTFGLQMRGTMNMQGVYLPYEPPEQLRCSLSEILQVCGTLLLGMNGILPKDIPSFDVLLIVVDSMVLQIQSPKGIQVVM